jgi:membrane-associated phospholipid phosphatase
MQTYSLSQPQMKSLQHPKSWIDIWKENQIFFIGFLLLLVLGFAILLRIPQGDDILFFNQRRTAFGDYFFQYGTQMGEEVAYLLVGLILVFYSYRHLAMLPAMGVLVTILSAVLKNLFSHPRPFKWFQQNGTDSLIQTIEGVYVNMGFNSFPSGHTMSAFALFTFLALCLPQKKINALLLLSLPVMVAISRIYLIKHFLKDVMLGAILGVILAVILYRMQYIFFKYPHPWLDKSFSFPVRSTVEQAMEKVTPPEDKG